MKLPTKLNLPNEVAIKVNEILDYLEEREGENYLDTRCKQCQLENNVGICDRKDCINYQHPTPEEALGEKEVQHVGNKVFHGGMMVREGKKKLTIQIPKPEWWDDKKVQHLHNHKATYLEALTTVAQIMNVEFTLSDSNTK